MIRYLERPAVHCWTIGTFSVLPAHVPYVHTPRVLPGVRVWDRPTRAVHPTVYHAKRLMQQLAAAGRLALYIDIHGHSTKTDTFFYGWAGCRACCCLPVGMPPLRAGACEIRCHKQPHSVFACAGLFVVSCNSVFS